MYGSYSSIYPSYGYGYSSTYVPVARNLEVTSIYHPTPSYSYSYYPSSYSYGTTSYRSMEPVWYSTAVTQPVYQYSTAKPKRGIRGLFGGSSPDLRSFY